MKLIKFENVTINAVGASTFDNDSTTYGYVEFKDAEGNIIPFKDDIQVPAYMGVDFNAGAHGDFYFVRCLGKKVMTASLVGGTRRLEEIPRAILMAIALTLGGGRLGFLLGWFMYFFSFGVFLLINICFAISYAFGRPNVYRELAALGFNKKA